VARLSAVADTGPLVAAAHPRERTHRAAAEAVAFFGRTLVIPLPVAAEVDYMLRTRVGLRAARDFLASLGAGEHEVAYMSPGLFRRAVEIDERYAGLDLGLADASVMAVAERHELPILTFDFADFRATAPAEGEWRLVIDEVQLAKIIGPI
jgi:predicted nucleic acid-binding protein